MITFVSKRVVTKLNYQFIHPTFIESETVLVFLHEALGSIPQWKNFPKELCETTQLKGLAYERTGHGQSPALTSIRDERYLHNYAQEFTDFIDVVLPNQKIILVGHSDGGTISLLYAHLNPKNVLGVVTMAAHVINEPETIAGISPAIEAYKKGKLDGLKKHHGNKTETLFYAWANTWNLPKFKNWDITGEISQENIPGLFIQGDVDQYGTIKQLELINRQYENGENVFLEGVGHHPHLENTNLLVEIISNWIKKSISLSYE